MAQTLSDQLDIVLNNFERNVPHVEATAVVFRSAPGAVRNWPEEKWKEF